MVPLASEEEEEEEDFDVEVKASEEMVGAGEPFNVTCVAPPGRNFQQQWLHLKKQASCGLFFPPFFVFL